MFAEPESESQGEQTCRELRDTSRKTEDLPVSPRGFAKLIGFAPAAS
jgi:hypothetical protein